MWLAGAECSQRLAGDVPLPAHRGRTLRRAEPGGSRQVPQMYCFLTSILSEGFSLRVAHRICIAETGLKWMYTNSLKNSKFPEKKIMSTSPRATINEKPSN